jgi:hypothetical protein
MRIINYQFRLETCFSMYIWRSSVVIGLMEKLNLVLKLVDIWLNWKVIYFLKTFINKLLRIIVQVYTLEGQPYFWESAKYLMREEFFWDCGYREVKLFLYWAFLFYFLAFRNIWSSIYYYLARSKFNQRLDRGLRNVCVKFYFNFIEKLNSFMRNEIIFYFLITRQIIICVLITAATETIIFFDSLSWRPESR